MLSHVLNNKKDRFEMAKSRRDHIKKKLVQIVLNRFVTASRRDRSKTCWYQVLNNNKDTFVIAQGGMDHGKEE